MLPLSTPLRFLPLLPSELQLATVLKSGQSFRWARFDTVHATRPEVFAASAEDVKPLLAANEGEEWAFGWGDRTVVLRQDAKGIHYRAMFPASNPPHSAYIADLQHDTTRQLITTYFQLDKPLAPLYAEWAARDPHFRRKIEKEGERLEGIRVLNQDPWETLVAFICSANNNIGRIGLMVNRVCESLGAPLPHPSSFDPSTVHTPETAQSMHVPTPPRSSKVVDASPVMYAFPTPDSLTPDSTYPLLRQLGFGYRAPFIAWTANYLIEAAAEQGLSPHEYLETLRRGNFKGSDGLQGARAKLMEFKGVGRKVADCIALFALGWSETVPVDTHVFQIAIRDYAFPSSKATALTPILHDRVCDRLQSLWGTYAGWAQQVLFFADLKSKAAAGTSTSAAVGSASAPSVPPKIVEMELTSVVRDKFKEELDAIMSTPGAKRRRTQVSRLHTVKDEARSDDEPEVAASYPSPTASSTSAGARKKAKKTISVSQTPIKSRKIKIEG